MDITLPVLVCVFVELPLVLVAVRVLVLPLVLLASDEPEFELRPWKVAVTQLGPDQRATSTDGRFFLIMQLDGNLVLYRSSGGVLWASNTGIPGSWLSMQGDGNLVMYTRDNRPVWSSDIRNPGAYTVLQNDGNVVEYDTVGNALWDSGGHTGHTGRKWL